MLGGTAPALPALVMIPRMDDEHWASSMFGALCTDRSQQQADESTTAAASYDEHVGHSTGVEEYLRWNTLYRKLFDVRRCIVTEGGNDRVGHDLLGVLIGVNVLGEAHTHVRRILPRSHDIYADAQRVR